MVQAALKARSGGESAQNDYNVAMIGRWTASHIVAGQVAEYAQAMAMLDRFLVGFWFMRTSTLGPAGVMSPARGHQ